MRIFTTRLGAVTESTLPEGSTIGDLADSLGFCARGYAFRVSGASADEDTVLFDGARVSAIKEIVSGNRT